VSPVRPLIDLGSVTLVGEGLSRPESVIATARGELFVSDHGCSVRLLGQPPQPLHGMPQGFLTNGIALTPEREFLVANLGTECGGGVWRIDHQRRLSPLLMEVDGQPMPNTNFVTIDAAGRTWISMSTRHVPREKAFNAHTQDGFIALLDSRGARIVADGIGFTNECRVDPSGRWLYVNETYGRCLSRFPIIGSTSDCKLGAKEVVHRFDNGDFPDGLAFDAEGGVWAACVVSNRVIRVGADGRVQLIIEDPDQGMIDTAEAHFAQGTLCIADVYAGVAQTLGNVSSVAFGGPDLKTVILGNLGREQLLTFDSPIAGAVPPHWHY
jgi:sugar lactone lactonase YvrE